MGAELWFQDTGWYEDPQNALEEIQLEIVRTDYDLEELLQESLENARESVRLSEEPDDDGPDLLEYYQEELASLEKLAQMPPPSTPKEEIERLRWILMVSGSEGGNLIDIKSVSLDKEDEFDFSVCRRLSDSEILKWTGSEKPTLKQAQDSAHKINQELQRGESLCFPIWPDEGSSPSGWFFIGNTVD